MLQVAQPIINGGIQAGQNAFLIIRKALNQVFCVSQCSAQIRLRVFAWGLCLGVSAYFCVLLQAAVLGKIGR